jgi:competence protein ComEA
MTRCIFAVVSAAFAAVVSIAAVAATGPQGLDGNSTYDRLPAGAGRDVVIKACVTCHDPQRAASVRLTVEGWQGVVEDMAKRGMKATEDERVVIVDYLSTHFLGEAPRPININTAEQIDFESVLGLLRREARAVIEYRDKNGPFKAVADLKKVAGLDYKKVEKGKDRVVAFIPGTR